MELLASVSIPAMQVLPIAGKKPRYHPHVPQVLRRQTSMKFSSLNSRRKKKQTSFPLSRVSYNPHIQGIYSGLHRNMRTKMGR
jgi:hypothetical protein